MSLRPGLGANAMHDVASDLMLWKLDQTLVDVPPALRMGSTVLPIGRYLRGKLRTMVGKDEKSPQVSLDELEAKVRLVRAYAFQNDLSVKSVFEDVNQPYAQKLETRLKLGKLRETL